ncbi:hypothetical protein HMSSN036_86990 [Paenibacillus macerans]|nr:hypothetical protein HMSSN036_86990 [Paenibacillus macerans]
MVTAGKLLKLSAFGRVKRWTGMALIALAVVGTLFHSTSRPGFWGSLIFIGVIGVVTLVMQFAVWKRRKSRGAGRASRWCCARSARRE